MIDHISLKEPGNEGVFDPFTRTMLVPHQPDPAADIMNSLAVGVPPQFPYAEWKSMRNLVHEIMHFHQFTSSALGWLYSLLTAVQIIALHFLLREVGQDLKVPLELPLVGTSNKALRRKGGPPFAMWCSIVLAEQGKRHLLPHLDGGRLPDLSESDKALARGYAKSVGLFLPDLSSANLADFRSRRSAASARRYGLRGVLESHADCLASCHMLRILEAQQEWSSAEKRQAVVAIVRSWNGPYDPVDRVQPIIDGVSQNDWLRVTNLISDLSLMSQQLVHPFLSSPPSIADTTINVDCMSIYAGCVNACRDGLLQRLPPHVKSGHDFQEFLAESISTGGALPANRESLATLGRTNVFGELAVGVYETMFAHDPNLTIWLCDVFYSFHEAVLLREKWPMLLAGDVHELEMCIAAYGSPSGLCTIRGDLRSMVRELRGIVKIMDVDPYSFNHLCDVVHHTVVPKINLFRQLLYHDKQSLLQELGTKATPVGSSIEEGLEAMGVATSEFQ